MDMKLSGKTVLITGGSRGIGFACAMAFAGEGCAVHIASRSQESLEAAREKIRARHNVPVEIHPADFSKGDTVRSVVDAVAHADILVNNAGAIPRGDIFAMTEPKWRESWELKVFGYINMTRAFYATMKKKGGGVIINILGVAGERLESNYIAGATGNAGLMAFTKSMGSASPADNIRIVGADPNHFFTTGTHNRIQCFHAVYAIPEEIGMCLFQFAGTEGFCTQHFPYCFSLRNILRALIESEGKLASFSTPYWQIVNETPEVLVAHVRLWRLLDKR